MVGCEISGGLGNQFFRYAIARTLLEERKTKGCEEQLMINARHVDAHGVSGNLFDFQIHDHEKCNARRLELSYGSVGQNSLFLAYTFAVRVLGRITPPYCRKLTVA